MVSSFFWHYNDIDKYNMMANGILRGNQLGISIKDFVDLVSNKLKAMEESKQTS